MVTFTVTFHGAPVRPNMLNMPKSGTDSHHPNDTTILSLVVVYRTVSLL